MSAYMKVPYTSKAIQGVGTYDTLFIKEGLDVCEAIKEAAWQAVSLDLELTIGGVTMFAAAWEDPEHWAENWVNKLGCESEETRERVEAIIIESAREEI